MTESDAASSSRITKLFFIVAIIAIPIIIIEGGFAIFLLSKRSSSPPSSITNNTAATACSTPLKEQDRSLIKQEVTSEAKRAPTESAEAKNPMTGRSAAVSASPAISRKEKDTAEENNEEVEDTAPANAVAALAKLTSVADNLKLARLYMGIGSYDDALAKFREVVKADLFNQEAIIGIMQAKKIKTGTPSPLLAPATTPSSAAPSRESTSTPGPSNAVH